MPFTSSSSVLLFLIIVMLSKTSAHTEELNDYDNNDVKKEETTMKVHPLMRFTYGDNDNFGPLHWRNKVLADKLVKHDTLPMKSRERSMLIQQENFNIFTTIPPKLKNMYKDNFCQANWLSPINIETKWVRVPELRRLKDSMMDELLEETTSLPETLIIEIMTPNIQFKKYEFGHPLQYHGIEIRPTVFGQIQLMDNFDPLRKTTSFTSYDFHFLTLFYCDLQTAMPYRTMHQINGKRYPLELDFVFLRKATTTHEKQEISPIKTTVAEDYEDNDEEPITEPDSKSTLYEREYVAVIVAVLGEIGPQDNVYFKPVVEAARKFHGKNFNNDDTDYERNSADIKSPWSPTWLLPDTSDYYYYDDGSFPVPPCWSVARYYIMRETIKISKSQLDVLTHIQSDREKTTQNVLACTHSIAVINPEEGTGNTLVNGEAAVNLNLIEYEMKGQDGKQRSKEEKKRMNGRKTKREILRKLLTGEVANENSNGDDTNNGSKDRCGFENITIVRIIVTTMLLRLHL